MLHINKIVIKIFPLILSLILIFSGCNTTADEKISPHQFKYSDGPTSYGFINIGVCKKLTGKVYTLVIFLDDDESSWNEEARTEFYGKKYFPSVNYLSGQAEKRNIELDLQSGQYTTRQDLKTQPRYNGTVNSAFVSASNNDILEQTAKTLGYTNADLMHAMLKYNLEVEQIAYVIVLNKPGRAYAVYDSVYDNYDAIEYVVAFSENENGQDYIGSSVLHELLHLFGAADLYDDKGIYTKRYKLCGKLFPNDIMRRSAISPESLSIGPLTEYLIGWSENFPAECDCPEWWERRGDRS